MIARTPGVREKEAVEVPGRSSPERVVAHPEKPVQVEVLKGEERKEANLEKKQQSGAGQPRTGAPSDSAGQQSPMAQVLKHISGYQPANWLAPISAGSLASVKQQLVQTSNGDPQRALTWQASLLLKILRVLFRV